MQLKKLPEIKVEKGLFTTGGVWRVCFFEITCICEKKEEQIETFCRLMR